MKEMLEFNHKKQCGLWLILIGLVLIISAVFGGSFLVNPFVFLAGYYACFFGVNVNKKLRKKLSQGSISKLQIKVIYISIVALFILMFAIAGPFIPGWHWRHIWLGVLLATAIHFLLLFVVHGWSMIFLGIVCIIISIAGYASADIPLLWVVVSDAIVKMLFGVYLFFISKPTKFFGKPEKLSNQAIGDGGCNGNNF
ncbi:DUF6609 family protein [Butyrivibrio sp. AE3004]|uniref:DUF6609 family protein n=1 Tax=Butyrivibrio sp. AE3004 TaxID=1506994 RepID=UPI000B3161B2|nr:DUF6609 family protein [Butyrivibrio sp. AE3004]